MDDLEFEKTIKITFLEEAEQMLVSVEQYFLALETKPDDVGVINMIFRVAHSFKGSAGVAGLEDLANFAHHLENLLAKIKNGEHRAGPDTIDVLLRANDELNNMVSGLKVDLERRFDVGPFIEEMDNLLDAPIDKASPSGRLEGEKDREADSAEEQRCEKEVLQGTKRLEPTAPAMTDENIRVNLRRIDQLVNDVGELVILQTVLFENRQLIPSDFLKKTVGQLQKITRKIQDTSMGLRLVPVKPTFQKMQRIVRDTGKQLGKDIQIKTAGEDTEIDKTILDLLADPLVHMIRNAVDHGIDTPEERKAAGKTTTGTITLRASIAAGHNVIEIIDDGRGLDAKKLLDRALKMGLVPPDTTMSDAEAFQIIFMPGFSTKEEVSAISGRGVGMDVVKTNVDQMQGFIEIESKLGEGSCFRILLPLTLAIINAMVITVAGQRYVVPLASVSESLHPEEKDISFVSGRGTYISIREETMQLFHLSDLLGRKSREKREAAVALVFRAKNSGAFAIVVDEIIGQQQVVIKRLGAELQGQPGISGAAILGDGKASLIIDMHELTLAYKAIGQLNQMKKETAA